MPKIDYVLCERPLTVVYKHRNNTIRLTIQLKAALTTCVNTGSERGIMLYC